MTFDTKIFCLYRLGDILKSFSENPDYDLLDKIKRSNQWFIREFVLSAIQGVQKYLEPDNLVKWLSAYDLTTANSKTVGIVMAGNIPMVGFHDLLCVMISGHRALIKTSHHDTILMKWLVEKLYSIHPEFKSLVKITKDIPDSDVVIATGSDNSARYFQYYFRDIPHIIRHNRSSIAILNGEENPAQLSGLWDDIFMYFGLGCRNVSKLFIPESYKISNILKTANRYAFFMQHIGYRNNYNRQKAIFSILDTEVIDGNFFLLHETSRYISPVSVVFFERYQDDVHLQNLISSIQHKIQCKVSVNFPDSIPPGMAQYPDVWDYADGVDTLKFLIEL